MKVVITGATGFIGRPLVQRMLAAGHEVTVITREARRARSRLPAACHLREWGPAFRLEPSVLASQSVVIHLAGESVAGGRWSAARKEAIRASRVDSTRALVAAIEALPREARPRALVAASAVGFYGDRGDEMLAEDSPAGTGFLADVCRDWEAAATRARDLGLRIAVLRIGIVLGRDGGALASLLPLFRLGLGGRVGDGAQWMSWIHLDDMVELLHLAATRDDAEGIVNAVAPHPVTNASFTAALAQTLHRPAILPAPASVLRLALGEMAVVLLAGQRVLARSAGGLGFRFRFPDLDQALGDLCAGVERAFEREQWFPRPADELFPFFADAFNLEKITPAFVHFRVLRTSTPEVGEGMLINYSLRLHGLPVRWQSRIDLWQPPRMFVDSETYGPYALWQHTHIFEPSGDGTVVRDRVRYRLPLGALGDLVAGGLVQRDLDAIFDFRHEQLRQIFGGREGLDQLSVEERR